MFDREIKELHEAAVNLAFASYLRKGRMLPFVNAIAAVTASPDIFAETLRKYNRNHDPVNGQFTSGPGDASGIDDPPIEPVYPVETALIFLLGGEAVSAAKVALGVAEDSAAGTAASVMQDQTDHGAARAFERGITDEDAQQAIQSAKESGNVVTQTGKYGTPQQVYTGSNGVTVVVETTGRNAGKIITLWRQ